MSRTLSQRVAIMCCMGRGSRIDAMKRAFVSVAEIDQRRLGPDDRDVFECVCVALYEMTNLSLARKIVWIIEDATDATLDCAERDAVIAAVSSSSDLTGVLEVLDTHTRAGVLGYFRAYQRMHGRITVIAGDMDLLDDSDIPENMAEMAEATDRMLQRFLL